MKFNWITISWLRLRNLSVLRCTVTAGCWLSLLLTPFLHGLGHHWSSSVIICFWTMIIIILDIGQFVQILLLCQTCLLFNGSYIECVSAWCLIVWFSDINVPRGRLGNLTRCTKQCFLGIVYFQASYLFFILYQNPLVVPVYQSFAGTL